MNNNYTISRKRGILD